MGKGRAYDVRISGGVGVPIPIKMLGGSGGINQVYNYFITIGLKAEICLFRKFGVNFSSLISLGEAKQGQYNRDINIIQVGCGFSYFFYLGKKWMLYWNVGPDVLFLQLEYKTSRFLDTRSFGGRTSGGMNYALGHGFWVFWEGSCGLYASPWNKKTFFNQEMGSSLLFAFVVGIGFTYEIDG